MVRHAGTDRADSGLSDFLQEAIGSEDELGSSLESLNLYSCTLAVETRADVDQPWPVIDSTKAAVKVWLSDDILDPEVRVCQRCRTQCHRWALSRLTWVCWSQNGASMTFSAPCEVGTLPACCAGSSMQTTTCSGCKRYGYCKCLRCVPPFPSLLSPRTATRLPLNPQIPNPTPNLDPFSLANVGF